MDSSRASRSNLLDWQAFLVGSLFGWLGDDGRRRFRKLFCLTAKGSGKTPLGAGISLYMIAADGHARSEGYVLARTADQAGVAFRAAVGMAESGDIGQELDVAGGVRADRIIHESSGSFLQLVSGRPMSGPFVHSLLVDEYHEHP